MAMLLVGRHRAPATFAGLPLLLGVGLAMSVAFAACGGGGTSSAGAATAVPSGVVAVEAKEYQFTPSTLSVPAGAVSFSLKNVGSQDHQLQIYKGDQLIGGIDVVVAGQTKDANVTLAAGDYTFVCKLNGHDQLGMKGTLTVTGG
jgi:plastocyanin